jgi:periplasmic protein TonB
MTAVACSSTPPAPQKTIESHTSFTETSLGKTLYVVGPKYAPRVISRVPPVYPEEARAARISGVVKLQALIDPAGNVVETKILEDLPHGLGEAAAAAVRQWKFEPLISEGKPIPVLLELYINFKLK